MLYIWKRPFNAGMTENTTEGCEYLFPDGYEYYIYNTQLLNETGVRVPQIIGTGFSDSLGCHYAIVEFFNGCSLADYLQNGGKIDKIASKIKEITTKLSKKTRNFYGSPLITTANKISAVTLAYNFYIEELRIASVIDSEIAMYQDSIILVLQNAKNKINEKDNGSFVLIHGELTPEHIFLLDNGELGVIDIEGIKYFDCEYDWAVIDFMYNRKVPLPDNIDIKKLDFYELCLTVGYMSGSADYLKNVDAANEFFINVRKSNLEKLKTMI
jgi:hypothetical protein